MSDTVANAPGPKPVPSLNPTDEQRMTLARVLRAELDARGKTTKWFSDQTVDETGRIIVSPQNAGSLVNQPRVGQLTAITIRATAHALGWTDARVYLPALASLGLDMPSDVSEWAGTVRHEVDQLPYLVRLHLTQLVDDLLRAHGLID